MAATAGLRHATFDQNQMYSIFQPVSRRVDGDASWNNLPLGVDGANEGHKMTCAPASEPQQQNDPAVLPASTNSPSQSHLIQSGNVVLQSQNPSLDEDPSNERRKRRKISGEHVAAGTSPSKEDGVGKTVEGWSILPPATPKRIPDETYMLETPTAPSAETTVRTPQSRRNHTPRSSTRKQKQETKDSFHPQQGFAEEHEEIGQASPSKTRKQPETKMLQLSSNGKLVNSPKKPTTEETAVPTAKISRTNRSVLAKKGKIAQSLVAVMRYGSDKQRRNEIGEKINAVLAGQNLKSRNLHVPVTKPSKATHPFFLGKSTPRSSSNLSTAPSVESSKQVVSDNEDDKGSEAKKPVPWKDIVFKSSKSTIPKHPQSVPPIWPPLELQHLGQEPRKLIKPNVPSKSEGKRKQRLNMLSVDDDENFLRRFTEILRNDTSHRNVVNPPEKLLLDSQTALRQIECDVKAPTDQQAISAVRSKMLTHSSAFDRAVAAGPLMWPQQFAPTRWEEVLQPSCIDLFEWLSGLAVHNVKQGIDKPQIKIQKRKKRPKRREDDLESFIVNEEDDDIDSAVKKTAILIVGPSGCGKTASVYAVAKQLGFEIFEIHPGMRRSAKDIFDKVGDMAQNHLVQRGESTSRASSMPPIDAVIDSSEDSNVKQPTVANLFGAQKRSAQVPESRADTPQPSKKEQKQSLILFEEVDVLFEDDRGFWSGVQSLIQHSKRPVVLTCNDPYSIPIEELDLHSTLFYTTPPDPVVVEYLEYLAAAEGHIVGREALKKLYASKGNDLRATVTELDFWCQMTVGSMKGGLDWFLTGQDRGTDGEAKMLRTFSKDTYYEGLDLCPQFFDKLEDTIRFTYENLEVEPVSWNLSQDYLITASHSPLPDSVLVEKYSQVTSCESDMDILNGDLSLGVTTTLLQQCPDHMRDIGRDKISSQTTENTAYHALSIQDLIGALEPLMAEKPTFPPAHGRLAASIDCSRSCIATDIAPYVRSIAAFDQSAEQHREALYGPANKKSRTTRAARAAAEGGNKASTRPERWFPKDFDLEKVLETGSDWPQWLPTVQGYRGDVHLSQADDTVVSSPDETVQETI